MDLRERLMAHVSRTERGCWSWTASTNKLGYGRIGIGGRPQLAHRVAWGAFRGPIPDRMCVCHRCDNPSCINPDHLFLGTHAENMRDMMSKGRNDQPRGSSHPRARLTEDDVAAIRRARAYSVPLKALSARFRVAVSTVSAVATRQNWRGP